MHSTPSSPPPANNPGNTRIKWEIVIPIIVAIIAALGGIIAALITRPPSPIVTSTPTVTNQTPINIFSSPTVPPHPTTPPSSFLYQANFSQDDQGWLNGNHSQQWTYNATDKVLQSDGTMPCCTPTTELEQVVLNAPTTFSRADYTIEARIKALGNNPYKTAQPPFFGLFFRGYGLNGTGYMAGIIASKPNANTEPYTFILYQDPNNQIVNRVDQAPYLLNSDWHTYWIVVQGNTYTFYIDQNQLYTASLSQDVTPGSEIGIEDYGYLLQIQSLVVYPVCTPYDTCPST